MGGGAEQFNALYETIRRLRAPGGCPWDREQTPESLRACLLEEAFECIEAIDERDAPHIQEELGDVLLVILMTAYIHEQRGVFSVTDVLAALQSKLIRRHPHVFAGEKAADAGEALRNWAAIKTEKEGCPARDSVLDEVSRALPALERAYKLQKKAAKTGFDWPDAAGIWAKIEEEVEELKAEIEPRPACSAAEQASAIEREAGDVLFSVVNMCRFLGIDPSIALHRTNATFERRFKFVEKEAREHYTPDADGRYPLATLDTLWNEAKKRERSQVKVF